MSGRHVLGTYRVNPEILFRQISGSRTLMLK